ncbi:MAG: alpha/beta fold hydrolase [Thermoguttaceae bacterium]
MKTAKINNSGIEIAYHEKFSGAETALDSHDKTIIFVHGFPLDHRMWLPCFPLLLEKFKENGTEARLIAPDMRGFGKSSVSPGTCRIDQFADDLAAFCDAVGISKPITLCGLSMGGYIAMEFARRHFQKLESLVLCDTKAVPDPPEGAQNRLKTAAALEENGQEFLTKLVDGMIPKLFSEKSLQFQPELVSEVTNQMLAQPPLGLAAAARGMASRADSKKLLETIDLPITVICGEDDAISPLGEMHEIAQNAKNGRFASISAAGHLAPLENPKEWADAFLAGKARKMSAP